MENQIYRVSLTDGYRLELFVASTNELNPYRAIKEIGICVLLKEGFHVDGELNEDELSSLINYLEDCKRHISNFNKNSQPKEDTGNGTK